MGNNCPSCSQCNNVNDYPLEYHKKPIKINDDEYKITILDIENEEKELIENFNIKYQNRKNGIDLKHLSDYYLALKKDKLESLSFNQIILTLNENINPFEGKIDKNEEIQFIKSELKKIEKKYDKKLSIKPFPPKFTFNLTQKLYTNYNFTFTLKNLFTNEKSEFEFKTFKTPLIFFHFDSDSLLTINKIKEIRRLEIKYEKDEDKNFVLFPILKMDKNLDIKNFLESNELDKWYYLTESFEFNYLFGFNGKYNSKCLFINRSSLISLILEDDDIELLNEEMINFYLDRYSYFVNKKHYSYFKDEDKYKLKKDFENDEFKQILKKFCKDFKLEVEFKKIGEDNYPINIRLIYYKQDKNPAKEIIKFIEEKMKNYEISKKFIGEKIENDENEDLKEKITILEKRNEKLEKELNKEKSKFPIKINIKDENSVFVINCNKNDKCSELMDKFFIKHPDYKNKVIFKFENKELNPNESLNYYNIQDNDTINVTVNENE